MFFCLQGAILFLVLFFDAGTKAKIRDGCSACWDRLFRNHHVVDGSDNPVTYSGGGVLIDHYRQRQPSPRMGGGDQEGSPAPLTGGGLEDPEGDSSLQKRSPMKTLANKIAAPMRKKKTYQYNLRQDVELAETVPMKKSAKLASLK